MERVLFESSFWNPACHSYKINRIKETNLKVYILRPKMGGRCQHLGDILLIEGQYI